MERGAQQSLVRRHNDELICALLARHGALSRAELAHRTDMTVPAALKIIRRLTDAGLVNRAGSADLSRPGPKASLFELSHDYGVISSLQVTADELRSSHRTLGGELLGESRTPFDAGGDVVAQVVAAVESPRPDRPHAIAIGLPGMVDPATGDIVYARDLPLWTAGTAETIRRSTSAVLAFDNEVNLRAEAERSSGAAVGQDDFLLLSLGSGVGAALVLAGHTRRGASGAAGEVGFMIANQRAPLTRYQDVAGAWELAHVAGAEHRPDFGWLHALVASEPTDSPTWQALAASIAPGIVTMCALIDPKLVVLAGEVSRIAGAPLLSAVEQWLTDNGELPMADLALSTLGDGAVLTGAFVRGRDRLISAGLGA